MVAVGEAGTIAAAAGRLNVSSPSISAAIGLLEAEFGTQLFSRQHAQGLTLTPGGQRIFYAAKHILEGAAALSELAKDITDTVRGPISVGCLSTIAPLIGASLRRSFEATFPETTVALRDAHQLDLLQMLGRAEIDTAITYDLEIPKDIVFEPLLSLPPYVMLRHDHPLLKQAQISMADLALEPMILLDLPLSREYFLSMFQLAGIRPIIAERTPSLAVARSLVANGFGFGLINIRPTTTLAPDGEKLAFVKLAGDHRPMMVGLASKRSEHRLRIVDAFHAHVRARVKTTGLPGMAQ
jgi:DNA-binding transcriptional LysR family regulator